MAEILKLRPQSTDYPVHTIVTGLVISTGFLYFSSKHLPLLRLVETGYDAIPLQDRDGALEKSAVRSKQSRPTPLRKKLLQLLVPLATVGLCARIELARQVQLNSACSTASPAVFLPLLVAVYDALRFQIDGVEIDESASGALRQATWSAYIRNKWRFLPLAALLSFGCYALTGLSATPRSTYICPVASNGISNVYKLQLLAVIIDAALAIAAYELSLGNHANEGPFVRPPASWYLVTAGCALIWLFIGMIAFQHLREDESRFMLNDLSVFVLVGKALALAILCCIVLFSVSISLQKFRFTLTLCRSPHLACYTQQCF